MYQLNYVAEICIEGRVGGANMIRTLADKTTELYELHRLFIKDISRKTLISVLFV